MFELCVRYYLILHAFIIFVGFTLRLTVVMLVFAFLRAFDLQLYLCVLMVNDTNWLVLHRYRFLILSGHLMTRTFLSHFFTRILTDFMDAKLKLSILDQNRNSVLTLVFNFSSLLLPVVDALHLHTDLAKADWSLLVIDLVSLQN